MRRLIIGFIPVLALALIMGGVALTQQPDGFLGGDDRPDKKKDKKGFRGKDGRGKKGKKKGGFDGKRGKGKKKGGRFRPPPHPVMVAIDTNKDGKLSSKEIKKCRQNTDDVG